MYSLASAHGVFAKVENGGGQHGISTAFEDAVGQMLQVADAAGGDDRDVHGVGHAARQRQVETVLGAVPIHAGQQDFAGAQRFNLLRPFDGIKARVVTAAMGEHLPVTGATCLASMATTMHCEPTLLRRLEQPDPGCAPRRY